jgi:signal transduction histidine kinase
MYNFGLRPGVFLLFFLLFYQSSFIAASAQNFSLYQPLATNVDGLCRAITQGSGRICAFKLEGTVLAADCDFGVLFLQDSSGVVALDVNLKGTNLRAGQRIRLCGTNYVSYTDVGLGLGTSPVVDADGLHSTIERNGAVFLRAGRHALQVNWFNWVAAAYLKVAYSGPHLMKQTIPDQALWQTETASGSGLQGLKYRCFEGQWDRLPDFDRLTPKKAGVVSNFDITVRTRSENVGLEFKGFLDIPRDGNYTFYLSSDDGGQLFLDSLPSITVLGTAPLPDPTPITAGQPLPAGRNSLWAEAEGTVTFLNSFRNGVEFELTSDGNRMRVEVLNALPGIPSYLLHCRVRVRGICPDIRNADGQNCAGLIVAAGWQSVRVLDVSPEQWGAFRNATISSLSNAVVAGDNSGVVHLHGQLHADPTTSTMRFEDGTGSAPLELLGGIPVETKTAVDFLSRWFWNGTNLLFQAAVGGKSPDESDATSSAVHVLTTALQVQQLKPEEAQWRFPVEIQGVVTYVNGDFTSLVIQDSTRAVYVVVSNQLPQTLLHVGNYCKIKGVTLPGEFSPIVSLRKATGLGKGRMPQPVNPTREQLFNGSLDAQYVELRGMVIATHDAYVTLLTSEGTFDVNISPAPDEPWEKLLNAIVQVRGCFFANWTKGRRVVLDRPILRIWAAAISVDAQAPTDLFRADKVRASKLMQFNPGFNTFQWVKVSGQIVHRSPDLYYLMDGETGLRFGLAQEQRFDPGDEVEVVGLVELGAASPLLRQAVARKTGHAMLPEPRPLSLNALDDHYDSTLVWVEGTLVDVKNYGAEQVLEMQVGVKNFAARLISDPRVATPWQVGSRLKLTGVFCALDGNRMTDQKVSSFELQLNSPADVLVVARPPWWTFGRLLAVATLLIVGLALAFVWITALRHQVERRTRQLRHEIGERERAEKIRAVEQERSRIARDLHDDLGSELTEISMLASTSPGLKLEPGTAAERLREIAEKSRSMVSALDGVVWVTNSKNDTLSSLIEYLASYAEEFLAKARIACRVELPAIHADRMIAAEFRHDVLLAVREALNNAVRHSRPGKVLLRLVVLENRLEILIQDDGCGFKTGDGPRGNGLVNLHERMHKLGGHCQIQSSPSAGTSVILSLPLSS